MKVLNRPRWRGLTVAAVVLMGLGAACAPPPAPPTPVTIYNSNPSPLPAGVASQGFQCCQVAEFGDHIQFAGSARVLQQATVTLGNWAIHSSPTNAGYGDATGWDQPLTLNIYAVGPNDSAGNPTSGALLATVTHTFHIPWRPEPDPVNCPTKSAPGYDYKWQSTPGAPDTNCSNSLATQVTFDLSALGVTAPNDVVWGLAFNTQSYGVAPTGVSGPYDSLNVGAFGNGASVGTQANTTQAWLRAGSYPYCDGGAGGTGTLRPDAGCAPGNDWSGYTPEISITAL